MILDHILTVSYSYGSAIQVRKDNINTEGFLQVKKVKTSTKNENYYVNDNGELIKMATQCYITDRVQYR